MRFSNVFWMSRLINSLKYIFSDMANAIDEVKTQLRMSSCKKTRSAVIVKSYRILFIVKMYVMCPYMGLQVRFDFMYTTNLILLTTSRNLFCLLTALFTGWYILTRLLNFETADLLWMTALFFIICTPRASELCAITCRSYLVLGVWGVHPRKIVFKNHY